MKNVVRCDVVSASESIYGELIQAITVDGIMGQLCVLPGHAPLLTRLKPGVVSIRNQQGELDQFYVSGGYLEVQPHLVTILADTAVRSHDIDEAAAIEARTQALIDIQNSNAEIDYAQVTARLMQAVAQLRLLDEIRRMKK